MEEGFSNEAADTVVSNHQIRRTPNGVYEVEAASEEYLKEAIRVLLLEGNKEIIKIKLYGQGEIMNNGELYELVVNNLEFLVSVEESQWKAQDYIPLILNDAVGQNYLRTLKEDFRIHLNTQKDISRKLKPLNKKFRKKLKSARRWRKASSMGLGAASVVVLPITSMIATPFVQTIIGSILASIPTLSDSFWKDRENALEGQKKLISSMDLNNDVVMEEYLGLINQVEQELHSLLNQNADLSDTLEEQEKVKKLIENTIEDLLQQGEECSSNIGNARKALMESILKINASEE